MHVGSDWKLVLRYAWSVRLIGLAAVLSGLEVILPVIGYRLPVSDLTRALVYFTIVSGAFVARFIAQEKLGAS